MSLGKLLMVVLVICAGVYAIRMTLLNPEEAQARAALVNQGGKDMASPFNKVQQSTAKMFCLERARQATSMTDFQVTRMVFTDLGEMELSFSADGRDYDARCTTNTQGVVDFSLY